MKCPGQDSRYWQPGAIFETECPQCGHKVEFFKDESSRRCRNCGNKFVNPKMDFGCATYCKYAAQCLGDLPPELLAQKEDLFKDRVALEAKRFLKKDFKQIARTLKVARFAEELVKVERGNPAVVLSAAYLHAVVDKTGCRQLSPTTPTEAVSANDAAVEILKQLGARDELIEEVFNLIGPCHSPDTANINFKVLHDARMLADLEDRQKESKESSVGCDELAASTVGGFLTESGRKLAEGVLSSCSS